MQNVLVRRIGAGPGDELVTDDPEAESYTIPAGHCWVLADNEELQPSPIDSRSFGPLPLQNVLGRIMYVLLLRLLLLLLMVLLLQTCQTCHSMFTA